MTNIGAAIVGSAKSRTSVTPATGASLYLELEQRLGDLISIYSGETRDLQTARSHKRRKIVAEALLKRLHMESDGGITFPYSEVEQDVVGVDGSLADHLKTDITTLISGCRFKENVGGGTVEHRLQIEYATRADRVYGVLQKKNV